MVDKRVVATALVTAALLGVATAVRTHLATAADDHELLKQTVQTQKDTVKTQGQMAKLLETLAVRHAVDDAKAARDFELCDAGQLDDETLCAAARAAVAAANSGFIGPRVPPDLEDPE
jgi:hypothetical protein